MTQESLLHELQKIHHSVGRIIEMLEAPAAPATPPAPFEFSAHSKRELVGVNDRLVACVHRALAISTQDFIVFDGLRTEAEQRKLVAKGASQTMDSKHLTGNAVDLVPWINGKAVWDWDGCYRIADAMYQAAEDQGMLNRIRWGGCWDRTFVDYQRAARKESEDYVARRKAVGLTAFLDGVHYELVD